VSEEIVTNEQVEPQWFVDLDWYQENGRSFAVLAQDCLCPKCRKRLKKGEISTADLSITIRDCCSKAPDFITGKLTILGSIFRLFLANGNQPLNLEELGEQLNEWRGRDSCRVSDEVLSGLLDNDRYYGLRWAPD